MVALVAYLSVESDKTVPTTSRIPPARRAFVAGGRLRSCLVRQLSWTDSVWCSRHQFMVTPTQMAYDSELSNRCFFCTISDRLLLPSVSHLIISSSQSSAASPSSSSSSQCPLALCSRLQRTLPFLCHHVRLQRLVFLCFLPLCFSSPSSSHIHISYHVRTCAHAHMHVLCTCTH